MARHVSVALTSILPHSESSMPVERRLATLRHRKQHPLLWFLLFCTFGQSTRSIWLVLIDMFTVIRARHQTVCAHVAWELAAWLLYATMLYTMLRSTVSYRFFGHSGP